MSLKYKIPSYQNIFDALISISVPIENIISVLNQSGYSVDVDFQTITGVLEYNSSVIADLKGGQKVIKPSLGISKYLTNSTQNIFDICLMTNGDINKIVLLINENQGVFNGVNSKVDGVFDVNFKDSDVADQGFKLAIKKAGINFTTGDNDNAGNGSLLIESGGYLLQEIGNKILL